MSLGNESMAIYICILALTAVVLIQGYRIKKLEKEVFDKDLS